MRLRYRAAIQTVDKLSYKRLHWNYGNSLNQKIYRIDCLVFFGINNALKQKGNDSSLDSCYCKTLSLTRKFI